MQLFSLILSSIKYYRRQVIYQLTIIALTGAIITGSLLTGSSVRESLKKTASQRLGKTSVLVSSGLRYYQPELVKKLNANDDPASEGLLELTGSVMGMSSQKKADNVHIYAVSDTFFRFHGIDSMAIGDGEVIINSRLSGLVGMKDGEEIMLRFNGISDIPRDAPFAPGKEPAESMVLRVHKIADKASLGNFSLSISQIEPLNVFLSFQGLEKLMNKKLKYNRLLFSEGQPDEIKEKIRKVLSPGDIGFRIRKLRSTDGYELISDRIFFDDASLRLVTGAIPSSRPVLTYLANNLESSGAATPYSFVAAIPGELYDAPSASDRIFINEWLANDLKVTAGDTIMMKWFAPDSLDHLVERQKRFHIEKIVPMTGIGADSLLMPEFPGISGSESCSDWDAGVPIKMDLIRDKDEEYWNNYKGTPKVFLNYESGASLWGNNYGLATAIRFPAEITADSITNALAGKIDPALTGFSIVPLAEEAIKAADEGVDFSVLFLSLGFFLIVAAIVLLSFSLSFYFDLRATDLKTFHAIGFSNKLVIRIVFLETAFTAVLGSLTGAFAGCLANTLIIHALNSVWSGAVQTNALESFFPIGPLVVGFMITLLVIISLLFIRVKGFVTRLNSSINKGAYRVPTQLPVIYPAIAGFSALLFIGLSFIKSGDNAVFSFSAGVSLFVFLLLLWRSYLSGGKKPGRLSGLYYYFYPGHAIMPVLFIAAGIFAFIITGINRKSFSNTGGNESGTGGYLLWCETTIPVELDLNSEAGRKAFGFDEDSLKMLTFTAMKKYAANDASCLNLNHIAAPSLIGADPRDFISAGAFSFASSLDKSDPWKMLEADKAENIIYGVADQTVLEWGLKLGVGDTLKMRAEDGRPLDIIIAGGLKSSVFQGNVIISRKNLARYFPSVSGSSVFLVRGASEKAEMYGKVLEERLSMYGVDVEKTSGRLSAFNEITNTYLSVFGAFGGIGMITGITGLGFVMLRNYQRRKREFALMLATGYTMGKLKRMLAKEQLLIIAAGIFTGVLPAIVASLPSLRTNQDIPWLFLAIMIALIFLVGYLAILVSVRSIDEKGLVRALKKE